MNILAARVPSGGSSYHNLQGKIVLNGSTRNDEQFRRISAYVMQDDHVYPHLTVYETLYLAACFYLPSDTSESAKNDLVEGLITSLGLRKARDTILGDEKVRGVSGGERKRACIAAQLIVDPAVLFLDEPTSGLDSFQAQSVMESMKSLANMGRVVISVIHQPRSSIFNMFDKLLILSEGRTMYFGDGGAAVNYFSSLGHQCPSVFNPSDYFLDILSPDNRSPDLETESRNRIRYIGDMWLKREDERVALVATSKQIKTIGGGFDLKKTYTNFYLLCWRSWSEQSRDIPAIAIRIFISCFFALILGGVYSNIGHSQRSIQNRNGLLFFISINQGFNGLMGVLNSFPKEKTIVNREKSNQAYSTLSYFLAKVFVEIPINVLPPGLFCCIIYWYDIVYFCRLIFILLFLIVFRMVQLNPHRFGYFLLLVMMESLAAVLLGLAVSAFAPTVEAANALGPPCAIIAILFGGFYINVNSLPIVANWLPYVSFLKWAFEALCINEYTGLTFSCNDAATLASCITTGEQELSNLSFSNHTLSYPVFGLGMVMLGFFFGALLLLEFNEMHYLSMGFQGSKYKKSPQMVSNRASPSAEEDAGAFSTKIPEYEMVAMEDDSSKLTV